MIAGGVGLIAVGVGLIAAGVVSSYAYYYSQPTQEENKEIELLIDSEYDEF